jgi:hypothetical protein
MARSVASLISTGEYCFISLLAHSLIFISSASLFGGRLKISAAIVTGPSHIQAALNLLIRVRLLSTDELDQVTPSESLVSIYSERTRGTKKEQLELKRVLILLCQTKILASDHVGKYNIMC